MKSAISDHREMLLSTVENTDISSNGLDVGDDISDVEADRADMWFCLSVILMASSTPSRTEFDAVIGYVREVRTGLEHAVSGLEHEPVDGALGYANGMKAGLDTALITLEHLARLTEKAPQVASPSERKMKHMLHICEKCELAFLPDKEHTCDGENAFCQDDLNRLIGWEGYRVRYPNGMWDDPINPDEKAEAVAEPENAEVYEDEPRPLGMREGSKKHRAWVATEKLPEDNGEMHIDDMLKTVGGSGIFAGVKDPRARFANLLSQFKTQHLVHSDNQGNYWLPNGKAAD
jgi:hypothetical protein